MLCLHSLLEFDNWAHAAEEPPRTRSGHDVDRLCGAGAGRHIRDLAMIPDWQRRRSDLNHDWLQNRFLTCLSSFLNVLDDAIEAPKAEKHFLYEALPQWPARAREADCLIRDFEDEMTPMALFQQLPLSRCGSATKAWLPGLVHLLWRQKVEADLLRQTAEDALADANSAFAVVMMAMERCAAPACAVSLRSDRECFARFRAACEDLSESLSRYPSRMEIE